MGRQLDVSVQLRAKPELKIRMGEGGVSTGLYLKLGQGWGDKGESGREEEGPGPSSGLPSREPRASKGDWKEGRL